MEDAKGAGEKELIAVATSNMGKARDFILMAICDDRVKVTSIVNSANAAIAFLGTIKKLEHSLLFPQQSPQPSGIIKP